MKHVNWVIILIKIIWEACMVYKFKDYYICPGIAKEIIITLYADEKPVKRSTIIKGIKKHHISNGGRILPNYNLESCIKASLTKLREEGKVENIIPSSGIWKVINIVKTQQEDKIIEEHQDINDEKLDNVLTLGDGEESIYVYYYSSHKRIADFDGKDDWPCKIGKTKMDVRERISSQVKTSQPENPIIAIIIKTDSSSNLERMFHSILTEKGKHIIEAQGVEWFSTNPEEINNIYNIIKSF